MLLTAAGCWSCWVWYRIHANAECAAFGRGGVGDRRRGGAGRITLTARDRGMSGRGAPGGAGGAASTSRSGHWPVSGSACEHLPACVPLGGRGCGRSRYWCVPGRRAGIGVSGSSSGEADPSAQNDHHEAALLARVEHDPQRGDPGVGRIEPTTAMARPAWRSTSPAWPLTASMVTRCLIARTARPRPVGQRPVHRKWRPTASASSAARSAAMSASWQRSANPRTRSSCRLSMLVCSPLFFRGCQL